MVFWSSTNWCRISSAVGPGDKHCNSDAFFPNRIQEQFMSRRFNLWNRRLNRHAIIPRHRSYGEKKYRPIALSNGSLRAWFWVFGFRIAMSGEWGVDSPHSKVFVMIDTAIMANLRYTEKIYSDIPPGFGDVPTRFGDISFILVPMVSTCEVCPRRAALLNFWSPRKLEDLTQLTQLAVSAFRHVSMFTLW